MWITRICWPEIIIFRDECRFVEQLNLITALATCIFDVNLPTLISGMFRF